MKIRLQSATEYLVTYGWAILIIAVVLGALFGLGIFNSLNFAPKASPNSCSVNRPNGPGSVSFVNLVGTCGNLPEYAVSLQGNGYVYINNVNQLVGPSNTITITGWFYDTESGSGQQTGFVAGNSVINQGYLYFGGMGSCGDTGAVVGLGSAQTCIDTTGVSTVKNWIFVAVSYNGIGLQGWICGSGICSTSNPITPSFGMLNYGPVYIGGGPGLSQPDWNGYIANIQAYNTSFSESDVVALYHEGIGGAPIALRWLQGWWPLNGNSNDYSGNDNAGTVSNVIYINNWENGYSNPA